MARITPLKASFNGGEFSPLVEGRTDVSKYQNACSILQNFLPLVQGPILRRGGTRFVQEVKNSTQRSWLFRFRFNVNQSFTLEFGDQYVRFFTNRGPVVEANKVITAATLANPCVITSVAHGYTTGDYIYISSVVGMTQLNGKYYKITVLTPDTFSLQDQDGVNINSTGFTAYASGGVANRVLQVVTPYLVADLVLATGEFALSFEQSGDVLYITHRTGKYQPRKLTRLSGTSWTITTLDLRNGPFKDINTDTAITVSSSAATGAGAVLTASSGIFQAGHVGSFFLLEREYKTSGSQPQWEVGKVVAIGNLRVSGNNTYEAVSAGTTGSIKPTHTDGTVSDGAVNWQYNHSNFGVAQITGFTSATQVTATIITRLPENVVGGGANTTYKWAHGLFSAVEGWPELVRIHLERLTLFRGIRWAAGVSGDYENFAKRIGGEITADAAVTGILPSADAARWVVSQGEFLLTGTASAVIAISKITTSDPFGPGNVQALAQNGEGSGPLEPYIIGDEIVFGSRSGRALMGTKYDALPLKYVAGDLTTFSEHLVRGGIAQLSYCQEPYSIVWVATKSGALVGFTFDRTQDVLAWHPHPIGGNGIVESVIENAAPNGTRDDLWVIVRRTINGVTRRYVEYMEEEFDGTDATIADAFYVDSGLTYSGALTTTISGLDHLKNTVVSILANGAVHPQKTVSATGTVTLDFPVTKAQIGLQMISKMRTMRIEGGSNQGTAQGKVKRTDQILLRVYKTLGGKVGPNENQLDPLIYRQAGAPMDTPPAMVSGDLEPIPFDDDYNTEGYWMVVADDPHPMNIITTSPRTTVYEN